MTLTKAPREVKVNLKAIKVLSWRFSYTKEREITHLYLSYLTEQNHKASLYVPVEQILDKAATFDYLETNFKDKCLEN